MTEPAPLSAQDPMLLLLELFRAHGVAATLVEGEIHFPDRAMTASAEIFRHMTQSVGVTIQLDVRLALGPGWVLVESCGGIGVSEEEALADAFQSFMATSFHILLSAFWGLATDQVEKEEWQVGGRDWSVTLGNSGIRGTFPEESTFSWVAPLAQLLQNSDVSEGVHWLRLYYAQVRGQALTCELLVDNEVWEAGQSHMAAQPWPAADAFYSVRLFLILQRGVDLRETLATFCKNAQEDDEVLQQRLVAQGLAAGVAEKLVTFLPLAFGRALLRAMSVRYANTAFIQDPNSDQSREIVLSEEPLFAWAQQMADAAYLRGTMAREDFAAIALRSAEVDAVNQALQAGAQPENLICSPPVIVWYF